MIRPACMGLETKLADHRSQAARTAALSTAPLRQALFAVKRRKLRIWGEYLSGTDMCHHALFHADRCYICNRTEKNTVTNNTLPY